METVALPDAGESHDEEVTMNLDDIISATCASQSSPCLVELARAVGAEGEPDSVGYAWSTGRITASVTERRVHLRRRFGPISPRGALVIDRSDLGALARACRVWSERRDQWSAFYASAAGYPIGFGSAWYYRAPGRDSARVVVGRKVVGNRQEGETWQGRDEVVPLDAREHVDEGVERVADVWRRGERFGDPAGALVGQRYRLGRVHVDARRLHAHVVDTRSAVEVYLEPGEEHFIAALARSAF